MKNKKRLDVLLTEQGYADTRSKAQAIIMAGLVYVEGQKADKPGISYEESVSIEVRGESCPYVSRGGLKLEKALRNFGVKPDGYVCSDSGASTGGFTDCALQYGASKVIAVDVGTNLMHESLRNNPKVELHEQTNIKDLPSEKVKNLDYVTVDVSFISLSKIFEKLAFENISVDVIALIKPQFECGKVIADKFKGVILNQKIHYDILDNTISKINDYGFYLNNLTFSPITGGDGNIEYLAHFIKDLK